MRSTQNDRLAAAPRRRRRLRHGAGAAGPHLHPRRDDLHEVALGQQPLPGRPLQLQGRAGRGLRRQRPGDRDRAPHQGEALEVRRGEGPPPQPLLPELLDEHGRLGQPVERRGLLRLGHLGRLRRVRPALEPVRQAPRRHRHPHPGLQLARLRHDRLERLGDVRPVRRRPDPVHRPRQRPGAPLPGVRHRQVAHVGRGPDLPAALWAGPELQHGQLPRGRRRLRGPVQVLRRLDLGRRRPRPVGERHRGRPDRTSTGTTGRTPGCGSATPSSAPRSGSTRAPRSTRRPRSTTRPTSRRTTWRPPASGSTATRRSPRASTTTGAGSSTSTSATSAAAASGSTSRPSTSAPSTSRSWRPAASRTSSSPRATTPPGRSPARPTPPTGSSGGNPTVIGYGGWEGNAQQVATINVDNQFTDFNEPMAETAIGWEGHHASPRPSRRGRSTSRPSTPTSPTTRTGRRGATTASRSRTRSTRRWTPGRAWAATGRPTPRSRTRRRTSASSRASTSSRPARGSTSSAS